MLMSTSRALPFVRSGIADLDEILGGLLAGDNGVWVTAQQELFNLIELALVQATPARERALHVTGRETEAEVKKRLGNRIEVIDARSGSRLSDPALLEQTIVTEVRNGASRVVFDGLAPFAQQWRLERAVAFAAPSPPRRRRASKSSRARGASS